MMKKYEGDAVKVVAELQAVLATGISKLVTDYSDVDHTTL